ncbi:hypothetical protein [Polyangium sp. y55x31]|uniref:hypothetical protein n=1 Tax=Polyangium sp. y55x31 TaxID=3042688 RepID=UPI0024826397|nr:hypothetical protein [Polyangium sp. y55x31]MDI1477416.1 hypothetical protein [Polyangium sp. y55x31]
MKRSSFWIAVFGLSALAYVTPARADVVGPPPDECPAGTEGASCHGGPYCRPIECTSDAECGRGETCKDTPLCVSTINCAGLLPPDASPTDYDRAKIEGSCPNGNECAADATCKTQKVCVPAASSSSADSDAGCGCRLAPSASFEASLGALALGLGVAAFARRRQRAGAASRASRQRRA